MEKGEEVEVGSDAEEWKSGWERKRRKGYVAHCAACWMCPSSVVHFECVFA